jgi:protein MPE1
VDKATALGQNADGDDSKTPSGIMVNADGEFVIAEPDKASWEQFQAKAKSNPAAQKAASDGDKEVQERGLMCPIDKKMFIEPMKTPCCEQTYCNDCITNALIESDFICPGCKTEGVLIDDLKTDEEAVEKINSFLAEKDTKGKETSKSPKSPTAPKSPTTKSPSTAGGDEAQGKEQGKEQSKEQGKEEGAAKARSKSPPVAPAGTAANQTGQTSVPTPSQRDATSTPTAGEPAQASKKRPAGDLLENPKIPKAPKAMQKAQEAQQPQNMMMNSMQIVPPVGMNGMNMPGMPMMYPGMPMMPNYGGMPMNMGMMNPMMNPMMGPGMNGAFPGMGNMAGPGGFNAMGPGMWPGGGDMGMNGAGNMGRGMNNNMNLGGGGYGGGPQPQQQMMMGHKNFSHQPADDDDAYFRKPVNPHRHQNRQRRVRPSDYREL